ncbi:MAG: [NiFe]-hydrogenase assembly chaperone HybE [Chromatiales bacterium]|nr:[NiFe]-hydrogenase assembly chaperone HybE [Chromatiales bacterium]
MQDVNSMTRQIEAVFKQIEQEQMQGIPLLNPALQVETIGFQEYGGRMIGVLITPWLMNLMLFPGDADDWGELKLGDNQYHRLPSNEYRFTVNEIDGIGLCQTHPLYSPMHEFMNQEHAVAAAESFMRTLMVEVEEPDTDPHDEALLGRILRGEERGEVEMDGFALAEAKCKQQSVEAVEAEPVHLTRRAFLGGRES